MVFGPALSWQYFFAPVGLVCKFDVHTAGGAADGILNGGNKTLHILPKRRIDGCTQHARKQQGFRDAFGAGIARQKLAR
ncbi:hypothetical protein NEILACOT_05767 [Neisseria lactamica ATCC 23970]|uniref:Uncharacterized protein n=1 Tax=Neisseria lactamica ATCC 23970 TaxID=546265 RepID=D0WDX9_NEILA|nr:hypothetical protein NEILACOT_05767 [Neisseria lactamica ATCC 23970]